MKGKTLQRSSNLQAGRSLEHDIRALEMIEPDTLRGQRGVMQAPGLRKRFWLCIGEQGGGWWRKGENRSRSMC